MLMMVIRVTAMMEMLIMLVMETSLATVSGERTVRYF